MRSEHAYSGALCVIWLLIGNQIRQVFELRDVCRGEKFQGVHRTARRISSYVRRYNSSAPSISEG
jgi:hypothetical protein